MLYNTVWRSCQVQDVVKIGDVNYEDGAGASVSWSSSLVASTFLLLFAGTGSTMGVRA
jgi:hypothetical protein